MSQVTIGGERLGSGNKMKAHLRNYERSTFDLSYTWRSTMACGTLVPFMTEVGLPGDTFDINLNCDVLTHPTIGPLFGSYKIQIDTFLVPMRLYNGKLHMNMLNIGMDMSQIKIPQVQIWGNKLDFTKPIDNQQINPSCVFSYLGIRGLGQNQLDAETGQETNRRFNAIPYLGLWDIYKNYYANKQEEVGYVIHKNPNPNNLTAPATANIVNASPEVPLVIGNTPPFTVFTYSDWNNETRLVIQASGMTAQTDPATIFLQYEVQPGDNQYPVQAIYLFNEVTILPDIETMIFSNPKLTGIGGAGYGWGPIWQDAAVAPTDTEPLLVSFPLTNIDDMRMAILADVANPNEFLITSATAAPYGLPLQQGPGAPTDINTMSVLYAQEGLPIKTYNSDLFNNWISTEWIDGTDGISAITAVDTSSGSFTIDALTLSRKVYDMLNRIAVSGGTYDDWLDAVYTHDRTRSAENPMYMGGLIQNLIFQEVVSNSRSLDQPLGTLAGRGRVGQTHKGGKVTIKVDEPSYIMGIVSLTPNVDYSQGNKWDTQLLTMNDLHKPGLDQIGFQDLITDQMAWWDTKCSGGRPIYKTAGKQPAWLNYMTNVDVVRGNFADPTQQMFMVLNRRYGVQVDPLTNQASINDLTTYIDPVKYNYIFADTRRDAQNFWTQIGVNITARRKMSSKIMPNL